MADRASSPGELELLARARSGDHQAIEELFVRHLPAALAHAGRLAGPNDAPDVVSMASVRVLQQFARGAGPERNFRAYLLAAVATCYVDQIRGSGRETPYADVHVATRRDDVVVADPALATNESLLVAEAFTSLPEAWQRVLWLTEVADESPDDIARRLGITRAAATVLAYRAREGLRVAYLSRHVAGYAEQCLRVRELPRLVRGLASSTSGSALLRHVAGCRVCQAALAELKVTNRYLVMLGRRGGRASAAPS